MGSPVPPVSQNQRRASPSCAIPYLTGTCDGIGTGASGSTGACAAAGRICPAAPTQNTSMAALQPNSIRRLKLRLALVGVDLCHGRAAATPSPQSKSAVADFDRFIEWPKPGYTRFRPGEGWGGGSGGCGKALPHSATPTPDPSPQGGGEEFAAPPRCKSPSCKLAPMRLAFSQTGFSVMIFLPCIIPAVPHMRSSVRRGRGSLIYR